MYSFSIKRARHAHWARRARLNAELRDAGHQAMAARKLRAEVAQTVCSATWLDDCLYHGAVYQPDFQCACALCRAHFPDRRHPRHSRQSRISSDCQEMHEDLDPDLAEELARLRNDRPHIGSVCVPVRFPR